MAHQARLFYAVQDATPCFTYDVDSVSKPIEYRVGALEISLLGDVVCCFRLCTSHNPWEESSC